MKNVTKTVKSIKARQVNAPKQVKNVNLNVNVRKAVLSARALCQALKALRQWIKSAEGRSTMLMMALMTSVYALGWLLGCDHTDGANAAMAATVVAGAAGAGKGVEGSPLTLPAMEDAAPGLLRSEIDQRIVKIRPMSTPLDQISRYGGARSAGSMKVEYYAVDTKPVEASLSEAYSPSSGVTSGVFKTTNNAIFQPSTTIMVPSREVGTAKQPLVLYVTKMDPDTGVTVVAVNNFVSGAATVPALAKDTKLVRMGRAAKELDVMTAQFEAVPNKLDNYCQIFKAQVEQSTLVKMSNKEVGWSFSDQEEAAIIDLRLGMEKSFLFGSKSRFTATGETEEVMLTGGIWNQTNHEWKYPASLTETQLIKMCRKAFSNNAGSTRKILLAGSDLIEKINCVEHSRILQGAQAVTKWGLDFTEIHSKFGTLYVLLSEVFDQCGHPDYGMVIDPEYITKYSHIPFRTERLNLRQSGLRNTDAIVITEASCLVLRYPNAHMRIVPDQE